jgi:hypothetical protein
MRHLHGRLPPDVVYAAPQQWQYAQEYRASAGPLAYVLLKIK